MQRDLNTIQFENKREVEEILKVIAKYVNQNPKEKENSILREFYDLVDIMDMEW